MSRDAQLEALRLKVTAAMTARVERHDRHFADQYRTAGGDLRVSRSLARLLGHREEAPDRVARNGAGEAR